MRTKSDQLNSPAPVLKAAKPPKEPRQTRQEVQKGLHQYLVSCIGVSPMLQNPMTDEVLDDLIYGAGRRKPPERDVSLTQLAEKKLCTGPNGEFGFPTNYLFAALVNAGRQVIFDKRTKMSTATSSLIPSFFTIVPELIDDKGDGFIPFKDQNVKWIPDRRRGVLAANSAAVAIVRPKFPQWAFDVMVEVDLDLVAIEKVKDVFNVAGRASGIGDFRPSKRGEFGKFKVLEFVEAARADIAKAA